MYMDINYNGHIFAKRLRYWNDIAAIEGQGLKFDYSYTFNQPGNQ